MLGLCCRRWTGIEHYIGSMSRVRCVATLQTRVRSPGAVSVLGQRHRRWASIESP